MLSKIKATASYIKDKCGFDGKIAVVLGSGLGDFASQIKTSHVFPYNETPNFPVSTVEGHSNRLIVGTYQGRKVIAMQGRFHYYEGYSMEMVTFAVRVFKMLGVEYLILSNAAGGINPEFQVGDLMMITDHINLFGTNPLIGENINEIGPRFPDMTNVYDMELCNIARKVAADRNIVLREGVYVGNSGPSFETPAEYKFFRIIGGDVVGMSTVPEAIVARHAGMKVFAVSVVTNNATSAAEEGNLHSAVLNVAFDVAPKLEQLLSGLISQMPE